MDFNSKVIEEFDEVLYLDLFSTENFHEVYNSSVLYHLQSTNLVSKYILNRSSYENCIKLLNDNNLFINNKGNLNFIWLPKRKNSYSIFFRYLIGCLYAIFFLIKYGKSKRTKIIFAQLNPFLALLLNFKNNYLKSNIDIICHGELEYSIAKSKIYKPLFLYSNFIKKFLENKRNDNIRLIVLSNSIKENLKKYYPNIPLQSIDVVYHPYIYSNNIQYNNNDQIKVLGTIGSMAPSKGLNNLIKLAEILKEKTKDIKIQVVGSYDFLTDEYPVEFVFDMKYFPNNEEFNDKISKLDVILFFYEKNSYKLTASGALLDAVNHNKIVLSLRNEYFEDLFNKFGAIGFLCDDVNEMAALIEGICHKKINIDIFQSNLLNWRNKTTLESFKLY
ncbi:TPA: hypothetical protein ACWX1I_002350 [Elizabethkingia anophelis]